MRATRILIDAPDEDVMSVADCKAALGITGSEQNDAIEASLNAAVASLDPASGGWLERALRPQTWELRLAEFPVCDGEIRLPFPPLVSITSVKYDDASGVEQTLVANTDYVVVGFGGMSFCSIRPAYGKSWPSARCMPESVRIRYVCGYEDDIPAAITQAIAMMVRSLLSSASRDQLVVRDRVDGIGEKEYAEISKEATEAMTNVAENLLYTYRPLSV